MIAISESKIRAQIAENDEKIALLNRENERLSTFLDPEVAKDLLKFIEISEENANEDEDDEEDDDEEDDDEEDDDEEEEDEEELEKREESVAPAGKFAGMLASDAGYAALKTQKPAKYGLRSLYDYVVKNGYKGSGNKTFEYRNFAIGIGQDKRILRVNDSVVLREWNLGEGS